MGTINVGLKSNGNYWLATWLSPGDRKKRVGKSLGPKSKLSRRQAQAACRQLAADFATGKLSHRSDTPRLFAWLDTHAEEVSALAESTRLLYKIAGQYLRRFFDHNPRLDKITADDAANWRVTLASGELSLDNKDATDPPGETTICKHVRTVKAIFNSAVKREKIPRNPFKGLKGNAPSPDRDWTEITAENMADLLDACPNDSYRALFALCRWVGLRRNEARELQWGDILWDKNKIMVNARVKGATTKNRPRVAPIEPRELPTGLSKLLRQWYDDAPAGTDGPCHAVHKHNLYLKVEMIVKQAGVIYDDPFHTLRKCWETELAMKYPLHVVVSWLGNTFEVARKHYLRVPDELYGDVASTKAIPKIVVCADGEYRAVNA